MVTEDARLTPATEILVSPSRELQGEFSPPTVNNRHTALRGVVRRSRQIGLIGLSGSPLLEN